LTDPLFIVGNGTSNSSRSNALTVFKNGNIFIKGSLAISTTPSVTGLDVRNDSRIGNTLFNTTGAEINYFGTGDRSAYIDFHGDITYPDFGLRLARNPSANGNSEIDHRGTGTLVLNASDAGKISLNTNGMARLILDQNGSISIGSIVTSTGQYSIAMGRYSVASGQYSTAMGYWTKASSYASTSMGSYTTASGQYSTAIGGGTAAIGDFSTAFGSNTKAKPYCSFVIGQYNDTTCSGTGSINWAGTDPLFIIGNGLVPTGRKNAFTVYQNGNVYIQGNLGIGTATPGQKLDIAAGNGRVQTGYSWLTNSDIRYKKNIYTLEGCLEKVMAMRGVSFNLISDSLNVGIGRKNIGFIAQELEDVIPEVVVTGSDGYKSVAYDKITAVLTEAIKEQQQEIESTKQENRQLKSEIDELKTLVNRLIANQTAQVNKQ
jgi:hypothetical protein